MYNQSFPSYSASISKSPGGPEGFLACYPHPKSLITPLRWFVSTFSDYLRMCYMYRTALSSTLRTSVLCMNKGLVAVGYVLWTYKPCLPDLPVTLGLVAHNIRSRFRTLRSHYMLIYTCRSFWSGPDVSRPINHLRILNSGRRRLAMSTRRLLTSGLPSVTLAMASNHVFVIAIRPFETACESILPMWSQTA